MSFGASSLVWHHSKATGGDLLVLMAIANYISDEGAWPKVETIANDARMSVRQAHRSLKNLQELGEITWDKGAGTGSGVYKTSRYYLLLTCPEDCSGDWNHTLRQNVTPRPDKLSPLDLTQTADKPVIQPVIEPNISSKFSEFWLAYPRKVAKQAAWKAFVSASKQNDPDIIVSGARRFGNDPNLPLDANFIPHPATWLNAGRWEDGPLPERKLTDEEKRAKDLAALERRRASDAEATRQILEQDRIARETADAPRCEHGKIIAACMPCIRAGKV